MAAYPQLDFCRGAKAAVAQAASWCSDELISMRIFRTIRRARKPRPAACKRNAACSFKAFAAQRACTWRRARSPRAAAWTRTAAWRSWSSFSFASRRVRRRSSCAETSARVRRELSTPRDSWWSGSGRGVGLKRRRKSSVNRRHVGYSSC
jgi:hypothetical protein